MKFRNGPCIKYYCIGCNYFDADYICLKDTTIRLTGSLRTPEECPMINITERKLKLEKLNEKKL